eukprot:GEMP01002873.1.p1 GENE.GEMP01002873.1~~GEMP01002873.1.p1  ORF type:complete len:1098 (+),score=232.07 GEMP01002873.1:197-3490(+)
MDQNELRQIEELCNALYNASNEQQRQHAHNTLFPLVQNVRHLPQLNHVLAHTQSPHALIFAATGLTKLLNSNWMSVGEKTKEDMKNFMYQYLGQRGPTLYREAKATVPPLIRLLVLLLKLLWLEGPQQQDVVQRLEPFLSESTLHWALALEIYTDLTCDMQPAVGPSMSRFRRTALSFRDTALPTIFQIAMQTLQQLCQGKICISDSVEEARLVKQVLQLTCNCLSFDFMGTIRDDTSDEQCTVMVPHSWNILRDEGICPLFFEMYSTCCNKQRYDSANLALQCLVLLSALRRSFFPKEEERAKLLANLVQGTAGILASKLGLSEDTLCYHEMCRLLGKINAAHQLQELAATEVFQHWIQKVYAFTMDSLRTWEVMPNSKHYLLTFWANMVTPLFYLREKAPLGLENCIQHIAIAYIESRLSMAEMSASSSGNVDWDDPLTDEVLRAEQLDVLANLGRYKYQETAQHIMKHYEETMRVGTSQGKTLFEKKITWIVYMMGAMVGGNSTREKQKMREDTENGNGAPGHVVNGEIASRVFRLIDMTDREENACEELELAYLYFLEQFRKVYIGEHAKHVVQQQQQVAERLAAVLGLEDENAILGLIINKVGKDLQQRYRSDQIVKRTLALFHELAAGINIVHTSDRSPQLIVSGRLLLKNETVQQILRNHASPQFGFLNHELTKFGKYRTSYYHTLGKLLFLEIRDNKAEFEAFMQPQAQVIDLLWSSAQANPQSLRTPESKHALIGLCRDLRGLCISCSSSEPYNFFFEWLVNCPKDVRMSRVNLFSKAIDIWWDDFEVTTPLLKFVAEFVYNKAQRITFDQSSPNGILLFREASSILVTYGTRVLQRNDVDVAGKNLYKEKYKGMGIALDLFCHALHGGYTNFGVFDLYNDNSLATSMNLCLRMCLAIPQQELTAYTKTFKPYYLFLELATKSHMGKVMELDASMIAQLLSSVEEGILNFDHGISMQCCASTDNIVAYFFQNQDKQAPDGEQVRQFQTVQSQSLRRILKLMFHLVMKGEHISTWSVSRPLLGLILLYHEEYQQIRDNLVAAHLDERRQKLVQSFDDLMSGVENNLTTTNKDHFTRNLYNFATSVRQIN